MCISFDGHWDYFTWLKSDIAAQSSKNEGVFPPFFPVHFESTGSSTEPQRGPSFFCSAAKFSGRSGEHSTSNFAKRKGKPSVQRRNGGERKIWKGFSDRGVFAVGCLTGEKPKVKEEHSCWGGVQSLFQRVDFLILKKSG